jgi:hypothetical protein
MVVVRDVAAVAPHLPDDLVGEERGVGAHLRVGGRGERDALQPALKCPPKRSGGLYPVLI